MITLLRLAQLAPPYSFDDDEPAEPRAFPTYFFASVRSITSDIDPTRTTVEPM